MGDLVLGHAGAFSRAKGLFLFLTPFIDIMEVLGVTAIVSNYTDQDRTGEWYSHLNQSIQLTI